MRPIDADAFAIHVALYMAENAYLNDTALDVLKKIAKWLDEEPTLDLAPVVHGEWIENDTPFTRQRRCSVCGHNDNYKTAIKGKFCWYCGAKMDGGKKDETN